MIVIGLSSGTSVDGIDAAVADIHLEHDRIELTPLGHTEYPYSQSLHAEIAAALPPAHTTLESVCHIDTRVGQEFATVAGRVNADLAGDRAELVASHGQTVYHWVDNGSVHGTLQLGQPAWIAETTGLPVVSDLRARDVAAGGQGAPLAAILDAYLLRDRRLPSAALNLGGIANVTVARDDGPTLAFDTGPANALLDAAVARVTGCAERADHNGDRAARGTVDGALLSVLLDEPYYRREPPKSTGRELFNVAYLERALAQAGGVSDADLLATLAELTARTVAAALEPYGVREVMASGGGTHNPVVWRRLGEHLAPARLRPAEHLGIDTEAKEAYLFALLGFLSMHGIPATLPSCTGATGARVAGSVTPGAAPLRPPAPVSTVPTRLRIAG